MKIVIFDINRLSFDGGAEKYLSEVGKTFKEKEDEVFFVGDCRLILKFYIWLSAFQLLNPIWKLPKLFTQLNKAPSLKPSSNKFIVHIPLKLTALCLFSRERKKVKKALEDSDLILIKNEIIEVLFFWLLGVKNQKTFVVIFSSLNYPFPQGFRAKIHNLVYGYSRM